MADTERAMDRLMVPEPYDMDTMMGTNNSGVLMFPPYLEDTDTVSSVISGDEGGDGSVYNAQDSVLWMNLRDAFRPEIATMYRNLRAEQNAKWSADYVIEYFSEMQSKWPEAMFNEDGRTKYLIPLIDPVTYDKETGQYIRTDSYLSKLQGSKAEQRKWWVFNRFRYIDSKYNAGDAASKVIYMRLFNGGTLILTPVIDLYVGVRFGGGSTVNLKRTTAGKPQSFEYATPASVTEMETWVYSADLIADLGDLSVFYPNEIDISKATRLRSLTIGSLVTGYSNTNLVTINASNNPLLEYINCANCPRLAISPDLEKSTRLKEAYFEGSGITGVVLADGCTIETLHLPDTITSLILMNLDKLTDLQIAGLSNVKTLMLSNMNTSIIDPISTVEQLQPGAAIYIDGLNLEMADAAAIDEFYDFLDTMKGVTRTRGANGDWIYHEEEKAQVSGKIHTDSLTGAEIVEFRERYPYIAVTADHLTATVYFHNWERDSGIAYTTTVIDGADSADPGTLTHDPTPANTFEFIGWSRTPRSTVVDADALKNVTADRHVYAVYQLTGKTFTVSFIVDDDTAQNKVVTNVPYNDSVEYGDAPVISGQSNLVFDDWYPKPINVTEDLTCYAVFYDTNSLVTQFIENTVRKVTDVPGYSITSVRNSAFSGNNRLRVVDLQNAIFIGGYAFKGCTKLISVNLPSVNDTIWEYAFRNCNSLQYVSMPEVRTIAAGAFYESSINEVIAPKLQECGSYAFFNCKQLRKIDLPLLQNVADNCFRNTTNLESAVLPSATTINGDSFWASGLIRIDLSAVTVINVAFKSCSRLTTVIIRNTATVASLTSTNAFSGTSKAYFYVPDNLVEEYKSATNWSTYADRIKPLSEVPEE